MKKVCFLVVFFFWSYALLAQTTITTSYVTNTITFSTGVTYVTFAVKNNNPYSIILTGLTTLQADLYKDNSFELWYSTTSLTGAPNITTADWALATSSIEKFNTNTYDYVAPFDCIGLIIPAGGITRFALKSDKGTCIATGVTPNVFTGGNVNLYVGDNISLGGQVGYFGWVNVGNAGTAAFFDGSITFAPVNLYNDVAVSAIQFPSSTCNSTTNNISAKICNKSTKNLNLNGNNVTVNFNISGPNGTFTPSTTLNSGILTPCTCILATVSSNISAQGSYTVTATSNLIGATDINSANNTKTDSIRNYKPVVNGNQNVCQYANPNGFNGFSSSGCSPSATKKAIVSCVLNSTLLPDGTNDATASLFASGVLPQLPDGAQITGGNLWIQNLGAASGSLCNQSRFNIYGTNTANLFLPGLAGNGLNFSLLNYEYKVPIANTVFNSMYSTLGIGGTFNIGYWETVNNTVGPDLSLNAQTFPTTVVLEIEYFINPIPKWYTTPSGGTALYNSSPFNPFVVPGSGITNTNTLTTVTYYAACSADTLCRVPVTLTILPSPAVVQDTMSTCEFPPSSSLGVFDLSTITNVVSNNNPNATVSFYQDQGLTSLISPMNNFSSTAGPIFSKVSLGNGCYASDTVLLVVHSVPQFAQDPYYITLCSPSSVDVANFISPFSISPSGTDTLYFENAQCTIPHPNPHSITVSDTVYIVFKTNTIPNCTDTATAYITLIIPDGSIANQDTTFDVSICNNVYVYNYLIGANTQANITTNTCQSIVNITDNNNNAIALGSTDVIEYITCTTDFHNGQPYLNRHYKITPSNQDSAIVCLYFLEEDRLLFNNDANAAGWPSLDPYTNLAISQVDNGDITDPGHTAVVIDSADISASYNPLTTVWTVCFPVDSFSYFYIHTANPFSIPLPIHLMSFTGKKVNSIASLDWLIDQENNADYVEVERSTDGRHFDIISGHIPIEYSHNELKKEYHFDDIQPYYGVNYYRLSTTDKNGSKAQSKTIELNFNENGQWHVYPNPTHDQVHLDMNLTKGGQLWIQLLDVTGRVIKQFNMEAQSGLNQTSIDLTDLSHGLYTIKVSNGKGLQWVQSVNKN